MEIIAFYLLSQTNSVLTFQILILLIITCYGGGFSCMPAYLADLYGIRQLSTIHGRILTAWGLAGIAGPMIVSYFHEAGYGYSMALVCFAVLFVLNTIIAIILKMYGKRNLHTWHLHLNMKKGPTVESDRFFNIKIREARAGDQTIYASLWYKLYHI